MPLGVEYGAPLQIVGPDGTTIVFNNSADPNFVGNLSPESSGLDSAEVREDASDATEEDGGTHGDFYYGRRPIVLQGTVIASSKAQRAERIAKIKRATNCMRADANMSWTDGGMATPVELHVRRQQPVRFSKGWVKDFMIPLVAAYPFITGQLSVKSTKFESAHKSIKKFPTTQTVVDMKNEFGKHKEGTWTPGTSGITAEDAVYTTNEPLAEIEKALYLVASNFNFGIPGTATIVGVQVGIKRKASVNGSIKDAEVYLIQNTGLVGANKAFTSVNWSNVVATQLYGDGKDVWSAALTPAGLNKTGANEAGVAVILQRSTSWAAGNKGEIDAIWMEVFYKEAAYPVKTVVVTNAGDEYAPPIIKIKGAVENPAIWNQTTAEEIHIVGAIAAGETITIDVKNRTVKNQLGVNRYDLIQFATTSWWKLKPGANTIGVYGDYPDGNAEVTIEALDTYV